MKKKLVCLFLCLCLLAACIPVAGAYTNVSPWAQEAVSSMESAGLLPESLRSADMTKTISRQEMCQMAVLVYNQLIGTPGVGPNATNNFEDTKDPAINYAFEQGIVGGYGDGKFGPNDPLTRQDFFKITHNMMQTAMWHDDSLTLPSLSNFADASSISAYAVEPTKAMVAIGVVQGAGNYLKPLSNTTREEAIVMFFRAYRYMCDWINAQSEETKKIAILKSGFYNINPWAVLEVKEMDNKKLIPESLSKDMSKNITRAQMCAIAVLAYEKIKGEAYTPSGENHFTDTSDPDVNTAYELGIVGGYGNGKFGPDDTLTREQFFKIMANFMKVVGYPRDDSRAASLGSFRDGKSVSEWAQAPTRLMLYIGAVRGDGSRINPQDATSTEQAVAIFLRCFKFTTGWIEKHPDGEPDVDEHTALINDMLAFARSFEGYPYVYGGNGPNSFDCSGFVLYVYKHFGYSFSRGAQEQYKDGVNVGMDDLKPGDLVFFTSYSNTNYFNSSFRSITHVGLYLGDGYFIHASNPTRGVVIDTLWSGYYNTHFWGACRIITDN